MLRVHARAALVSISVVAGFAAAPTNGQPAGEPPQIQIEPVPPTPIPVPDGPVVKRAEFDGGLIAEDLKIGDGYEVKPGGAVVAYFHGTLKDGGRVFESSFERAEPVSLPLSGMIPGWQKGVPGMKVGGVRRLTIPAAMAWGERGAGADIPPNADVVFTIQLIDALQVEDLKVGDGEEASIQCVAATACVVKDKDGKEVERAEATKPYLWLPGEFQPVQFGIEGMKVGGKRRLIVPKEMNVTAPGVETSRPAGVPLTIEIDLVSVRNLGGPRRR
ncbi:MAG: FKBP-type peptidyl-prolyl cis-trans isomerase [Phycisphaerae bacterium]|nr:FKBP-type peptidyl-prolyl cis-trans isomerase [Phycisphaerae bacterium]